MRKQRRKHDYWNKSTPGALRVIGSNQTELGTEIQLLFNVPSINSVIKFWNVHNQQPTRFQRVFYTAASVLKPEGDKWKRNWNV